MKYLSTGLRYLLATLSGLALLLTVVSVVPSNKWWVQALGFPRLQTLGVLFLGLLGWLALGWAAHQRVRLGLLLTCAGALVVQAFFLVPYLPIAPKAVPNVHASLAGRPRILVINALVSNRQDVHLRQLVTEMQPDVQLALKPDDSRALRPLQSAYPYRIELPHADAYGMLLYSRLPLTHTKVQNLLQHGVHSIRTRMLLPDGRKVTFFGIHPTLPIPNTYADGLGLRGEALQKVSTAVREKECSTIVASDFNGVNWSSTIHQLTRAGGLHDVSLGRDLFNTFDACSHLARWPLDHFFVSTPFEVVMLKRLRDVGADHFSLYAELALPDEPAHP